MRLLVAWVLASLVCTLPAMAVRHDATFFVAPDGNDGWTGKLPAPSAERPDGPFATLQRARDAAATQSVS